MKAYTPRPYQSECVRTLVAERAKGAKRGLVNMASGLGKTLTAAFDIEQFLLECPNAHILVLCHRETILLQTKRKFQQCFGEEYSYGMYTGNYKSSRLTDFTFATFQTLQDHRENFAASTFDYIMVDEAHHSPAATYRPTIDYFTPQFLLGLTATPRRMDGQDLLDIYERELFVMDIYDGWMQDYLAKAEYCIMLNDLDEAEFKKYLAPEDSGLKVSLAQLNKSIFSERTDADIAASIREQISDLDDPTVFVFCNSVAQAEAMAYHFDGKAAMIHSKQSFKHNQAILDKFYAGEIKTILSVDMLNEGIDIPSADVVVFLRATESTTVFFQQLGRGARITEGKRTMRVLDYVSNVERISMILEMEKAARKRYETSSVGSLASTERLPPIEVKIPKVRFTVRKVDLEAVLMRTGNWTAERLIAAYFDACVKIGTWLSLKEFDEDRTLPSSGVIRHIEEVGTIKNLRQIIRNRYPHESAIFDKLTHNRNLPTKVLVRRYYDASIEAGHWLSSKEVQERSDLPSRTLFNGRVGGIVKARQLAIEWFGDFQVDRIVTGVSKTDEQLLREYYDASIEIGHWLTDGEIAASAQLTSSETYRHRFNGIKKMRQQTIELFGDPFIGGAVDISIVGIDNKQIVRNYFDESVKAGRWLEVLDFKNNGRLPSYVYVRKHIGGVAVLRKKASEMFGIPEFEKLKA